MIASIFDRLLDGQGWLDPVGETIQALVGGIYGSLGVAGQRVKSFFHGAWFGHALHPVLTDVPLGAWTVALVADLLALVGKVSPAVGGFCVVIGFLGALGAAVTGYTDHHETYGRERRAATAHGLMMTTVTVLYAVSLLLRWLGGPGAFDIAVFIAVVGWVVLATGAYIGGDLVFGMGTMVNRNAYVEVPENFIRVGTPNEFAEGAMRRVVAGDLPVLVVRQKGVLHAIADTCGHAGGPLHEGTLDGCVVTCPWHGSQFDVTDGRLLLGPATFAQPALTVRERDGIVEVASRRPEVESPTHGAPQPAHTPSAG